MTKSRLYSFYGLTVETDMPLPLALASPQATPDLVIINATLQTLLKETPADRRDWENNGRDFLLRYAGRRGTWTSCTYHHARRQLIVDSSHTWEECTPIIVGVVAAALLRTRGQLVLHGSAVAFGHKTAAFLGPSGAGKSTIAGALVSSGAALVSDDLVVPSIASANVIVHSGHQQLRLLDDSRAGIGIDMAALDLCASDGKFHVKPDQIGGLPAPVVTDLRGVFMLEPHAARREDVEIEQLNERGATIALMRSMYAADWMAPPDRQALTHFAEIATRTPVYRLACARNFTALRQAVELVRAKIV